MRASFVCLVALAFGGCASGRTYERQVAEMEVWKREQLAHDGAVMARLAQLDQENADLMDQLDRNLDELRATSADRDQARRELALGLVRRRELEERLLQVKQASMRDCPPAPGASAARGRGRRAPPAP
jgi:hypothetical protein